MKCRWLPITVCELDGRHLTLTPCEPGAFDDWSQQALIAHWWGHSVRMFREWNRTVSFVKRVRMFVRRLSEIVGLVDVRLIICKLAGTVHSLSNWNCITVYHGLLLFCSKWSNLTGDALQCNASTVNDRTNSMLNVLTRLSRQWKLIRIYTLRNDAFYGCPWNSSMIFLCIHKS